MQANKREIRLLGILSFVHSTLWRSLFGKVSTYDQVIFQFLLKFALSNICGKKVADSLEKGTENEDEYMISERELLVNRYLRVIPHALIYLLTICCRMLIAVALFFLNTSSWPMNRDDSFPVFFFLTDILKYTLAYNDCICSCLFH